MTTKNACPVLPLAREAKQLADAISEADEAADYARASALNERLQAIESAASQLNPKKVAGARHQIRLIFTLADRIHLGGEEPPRIEPPPPPPPIVVPISPPGLPKQKE